MPPKCDIISSNDKTRTSHRLHRGYGSRYRRYRRVVLQEPVLDTAYRKHRHRSSVCRILLEVPEVKVTAIEDIDTVCVL